MTEAPLRLGTRGSALALAQAKLVAKALGGAEIVPIKTSDKCAGGGDKARFVREIERALLDGEVDLGVHSAKDLPTELPEGLEIAGVPAREDPARRLRRARRLARRVPRGLADRHLQPAPPRPDPGAAPRPRGGRAPRQRRHAARPARGGRLRRTRARRGRAATARPRGGDVLRDRARRDASRRRGRAPSRSRRSTPRIAPVTAAESITDRGALGALTAERAAGRRTRCELQHARSALWRPWSAAAGCGSAPSAACPTAASGYATSWRRTPPTRRASGGPWPSG